jgi:hypothetical protein
MNIATDELFQSVAMETALEASKPLPEGVKANRRFVPNLSKLSVLRFDNQWHFGEADAPSK